MGAIPAASSTWSDVISTQGQTNIPSVMISIMGVLSRSRDACSDSTAKASRIDATAWVVVGGETAQPSLLTMKPRGQPDDLMNVSGCRVDTVGRRR